MRVLGENLRAAGVGAGEAGGGGVQTKPEESLHEHVFAAAESLPGEEPRRPGNKLTRSLVILSRAVHCDGEIPRPVCSGLSHQW